jgi:hypothetical protein
MTQDAASLAKDAVLMEQALRSISGFAPWSAESMNRLLSRSRVGRHVRRDVLMIPLDPVQILAMVSGHVVVAYSPPSGRSRTAFLLAGPASRRDGANPLCTFLLRIVAACGPDVFCRSTDEVRLRVGCTNSDK